MVVLYEPLTLEQIKKREDENGFIEGIIPVDLNEIINLDKEQFLDLVSERLTGCTALCNIDYSVIGSVGPQTILINVSGTTENLYEFLEE